MSIKYMGRIIHGLSDTRFHIIWQRIRQRCNNKNTTDYKYYGGRGISVDCRWDDFVNFMDDMYDGYLKHVKVFGEKNTTIDRINNTGNYCKDNCRWATMKTQNNNSSRCHFIKYKNKTLSMSAWGEFTGLGRSCIKCRLKNGWSIKKALTTKKLR